MDFAERKALRQRFRQLAEPVVESIGCELIGVQLTGDLGGPILRLSIDKPGGVRVADCTRVSRNLSPELDVEDPLPTAYRLEVSSPGSERPVERPADFARFTGFRAKVRMAPGWGRRRYVGVLGGLDGDTVLLEVGDDTQRLPLDQVDFVNLDLSAAEFERLSDPTAPPQPDPPTPASPSRTPRLRKAPSADSTR